MIFFPDSNNIKKCVKILLTHFFIFKQGYPLGGIACQLSCLSYNYSFYVAQDGTIYLVKNDFNHIYTSRARHIHLNGWTI